ncbi:coiled-coil domain-containing protein 40 isoform X1 [Pieris brassicae]|uniref:coiled-coil domain-containing protein 40 isoform X1 n=1 Tax=Pieris brassicae TaxID=7116 RepID=UPI001E65EFA8|nr:coiled-coil domain-containing protein 40 isoform X1 [Pieris brassicae]
MSEDKGATCPCTESPKESRPSLPECVCPRDEHDLVTHHENCIYYRNEKLIFPQEHEACECYEPPPEDGICACCRCPPDQCRCAKAGREVFDEWRSKRDIGAMPAVLEASHPLMQRFQQTLKQFLEKENAIAQDEILNLREELRLSKVAYEKDLEAIYRSDHDTNAQRVLIEEYESTLAQSAADRQAAEQKAREANDQYRKAKEKLDQHIVTEREATEELEALTSLCKQLESWREETESDLTVSQRMSDKMRAEKQALADEKRQLDMIIYGLSNEVWKLESKLEMFKKQMEIKNNEMENVNDKVTAYAAELEDLELDKKRLVSLWNSVLMNIQQRDRVYDSVRDDYRVLQENYRTLLNNLEITKKVTMEEMNKGKEIAMNKDKLEYDITNANKLYETEESKRANLVAQIAELTESIDMTQRDQDLLTSENQTMRNILKSTEKEYDHRVEQKLKLENEILTNLQECLLNDKAVESMANGIKKMREISRKQEIALMAMENQHAKMMLDIELHRNRQAKNKIVLDDTLAKVREREKEIEGLQEKYDQKALIILRKQRELDIIIKKYNALKEVFDLKSPQERRIEELEQQIKSLRERTENMQHEWLRLQGHVVKLTAQHHKIIAEVNLINKQIQICDQKTMRIQAECLHVDEEKARVERSLRELRGRLELLERTRKDSTERNQNAIKANVAVTHEYVANLKDAETEIIQLEEDIEAMEKDKINLTQDLDRVQREALIWQRKGILAVDLKRNIQNAKSAAGEIGQMRAEIHRMEVRREQLRKTGEKLAEDLALYVTRRETVIEKSRAAAAVEKAHGSSSQTSQSTYHHKLRLVKADVARVTKDLTETKQRFETLETEQVRLEREVADTSALNAQLEERVATLMRHTQEAEKQKQWLLERVVRSQRLGSELGTAIKRQTVHVRKPKAIVVTEYNQAKTLNDKMKYIVEKLLNEYPYLSDRLEVIANTLDIHTPTDTPTLVEECVCIREEVEGPQEVPERLED